MTKLKGYQRKYLRGAAHSLKPVILIGQKGFTPEVLQSAEAALDHHELCHSGALFVHQSLGGG